MLKSTPYMYINLITLALLFFPACQHPMPHEPLKTQKKHPTQTTESKQEKTTTTHTKQTDALLTPPQPKQEEPTYTVHTTLPTPLQQCPPLDDIFISRALPKEHDQLTPKYDEMHEYNLIPSRKTHPKDSPFKLSRTQLVIPKSSPTLPHLLSWESTPDPSTSTTSGLIRARIKVKKSADFSILLSPVNTSAPQPAITFDGDQVFISLFHHDQLPTPLSSKSTIYNLKRRKELELIVTKHNQFIHLQLHDARNGVELISQSVTLNSPHTTPIKPTIALLSNHQSSPNTTLTHLGMRPLCTTKTTDTSDIPKPPRIFALLTPEDVDKATNLFTPRNTYEEGNNTLFEISQPQLEALFCHDISPQKLSTKIPWKALDPDYQSFHKTPVVQHPDTHAFYPSLSLKNPEMVTSLMQAMHDKHKDKTILKTIGYTHQNRPITAIAIANNLQPNDARPAILLNGAHHGDELLSTEIVFDAMHLLLENPDRDPRVEQWLDHFVIWLVPQVNPDGAHTFINIDYLQGRKNGRDHTPDTLTTDNPGVDLNRNYPFKWGFLGEEGSSSDPTSEYYRGPEAGSEPETQAIMTLAKEEVFAASISYHSGTVCIIAPYTIDHVPQPTINDAWALGNLLSKQMPKHPEGRYFKLLKNLYPVDGTDQDWLRANFGTNALLIETIRRPPRNRCDRLAAIQANRASYTIMLDRLLSGPSITGHVLTEDKKPVPNAELIIKEQELQNQEHWHTRPRDGLFFRTLIKPGTYTIIARAKGYNTLEQQVDVKKDHPTSLELTLKPSQQN